MCSLVCHLIIVLFISCLCVYEVQWELIKDMQQNKYESLE